MNGNTATLTRQPWTSEQDWRLLDLLGNNRTYVEIGECLGRTKMAVKTRANKEHNSGTFAQGMTAKDVGDLLGVSSGHTVLWWLSKRWLKGKRVRKHRVYRIELDAVHKFLEKEEHWHRWHPNAITDLALKEWASDLRGGVEFLSTIKAAARLGYSVTHFRHLMRDAKMREYRLNGLLLFYRSDDLDKWRPKPAPTVHLVRRFTPEEDESIRAMAVAGVSLSDMARELRRSLSSVSCRARRIGIWGER